MTKPNTQVIRGLRNCRQEHKKSVLTIGNFDGLHLGHQKMLEQLRAEAERLNTHSCLMTFEPLPSEFFSKTKQPARMKKRRFKNPRLMNCGEKIRTLCKFSPAIRPDYLLFLKFNQTLANMSATQFIEDILIDTLEVQSVIVGNDFRFGRNRQGDFDLLEEYGDKHQFSVIRIKSQCIDDQRIGSSLIREALVNNQLTDADKMLGRAYTICGRVNHGDKLGRTIGFPTANIHLKRIETPLHGVYSVTMHSQNYGDIAGVASIGNRPTVNGKRVLLEVHLFDFDESIYGEQVCVSFQHKIRDEKKFDSFDELKQQIQLDYTQAKNLLIT